MERVRMAVVGVGHLGRHHARILAGLDGVELVAVADTRIEQARAVAGPLGVEAVADYRDLLDRVDAVSIAVPTTLHHPVAGAFLERRVPTLVEKPLAGSVEEAEELVALARQHGTLLQVGHIERYNPSLRAIEEVGLRPKFVEAERLGPYTFRSTDIGVVLDLMIHDLDLLLSLVTAPVRRVSAVGVSVFGGHEDVANARIEFADGCVANLTASRASVQPARKLRLWGEAGYVGIDLAHRQATMIRPGERLRAGILDTEGLDLSQPAAIKAHLFGKVLRMDVINLGTGGPDQLTVELQDFVRAVREGTRPRVTGEDALRAMQVAGMVIQSLEEHQWEGRPDGPIGPRREVAAAAPSAQPIANLPAPKSWRYRPASRVRASGRPGEGGDPTRV